MQNSKEATPQTQYNIKPLTKELAEKHTATLAKLADQIPLVDYTEEQILAEEKGERVFYGKWNRSLIMFDGDKPIGFITGYERQREGNEQYPANTIYICELAVNPNYQKQGLGRRLVQEFLKHNQQLGMVELDGETNFSIQTNSADFNQHVIDLYKSFGFTPRATKEYDNRTDVVLGYQPAKET